VTECFRCDCPEDKLRQKRLRTLKDLDKSALALAKVCALLLDENLDDESLRPSVFAKFSREKLAQSVSTVHELARPYDDNFHEEMVEQYGRVRRFLPKLLRDIEFSAAPAGDKTLEVHQYLAQLLDSKKTNWLFLPIPRNGKKFNVRQLDVQILSNLPIQKTLPILYSQSLYFSDLILFTTAIH